MPDQSFGSILISFMLDVAILAGIPLAVATVSGLIVSFLQAITQIQDQTLSQTVKIIAIFVVLISFSGALIGPLITSAQTVFDEFHTIVR